MKPQAEIIEEIDKASSQNPHDKPFSAVALIFLPPSVLLRQLLLKGELFRGVAGVKQAVNASALSFITIAKRYEEGHKDTREREKNSKDFL